MMIKDITVHNNGSPESKDILIVSIQNILNLTYLSCSTLRRIHPGTDSHQMCMFLHYNSQCCRLLFVVKVCYSNNRMFRGSMHCSHTACVQSLFAFHLRRFGSKNSNWPTHSNNLCWHFDHGSYLYHHPKTKQLCLSHTMNRFAKYFVQHSDSDFSQK